MPSRPTNAALKLLHRFKPYRRRRRLPPRSHDGLAAHATPPHTIRRGAAAAQPHTPRLLNTLAPIFPRVFPKPSVQFNRPILTTSAATASPLKVIRPRQIKQLTHRPQPQSLTAYTKRSPLSITPPQHRHDGLSTSSQYRPNGHNAIMS